MDPHSRFNVGAIKREFEDAVKTGGAEGAAKGALLGGFAAACIAPLALPFVAGAAVVGGLAAFVGNKLKE